MALGTSIVGQRQSVLAILLMVGVSAVVVPTPDFGPNVLAMALWSLVLLHTWRVFGEGQRRYWVVLAVEVGLLLLSAWIAAGAGGPAGSVPGRDPARTRAAAHPRTMARRVDCDVIVLPYALWLARRQDLLQPVLAGWRPLAPVSDAAIWLRLLGGLLVVHAGAVLLIALASGWPFRRKQSAPRVERTATAASGMTFVIFFAIAPPLDASLVAVLYASCPPLVAAAPLVVLSGLAVVLLAGEAIRLHRQ